MFYYPKIKTYRNHQGWRICRTQI